MDTESRLCINEGPRSNLGDVTFNSTTYFISYYIIITLRDDGVGPHVAVAGSIPASAIPKKGVSLLSKNASYKR